MIRHKPAPVSIGLGILIFLFTVLVSFVPVAESSQNPSPLRPPHLAQLYQTQPISGTTALADVVITEEALNPPTLVTSPGETIQWINQTDQALRLEGAGPISILAPTSGTIFLPLIVRESSPASQANLETGQDIQASAKVTDSNDPTAQAITWQSGDIAPGAIFSHTFDEPGQYNYTLTGSSPLAGLVIVQEPTSGLSEAATVALVVSTTADDRVQNGNCTLREAIIAANSDTAVDACFAGNGADTIILAAGVYTLTITGQDENFARKGDLDIKGQLTIIGAGARVTVIDAGALSDRVFEVLWNAKLTLSGVTVANGRSNEGAGIYNRGILTLNNAAIQGNTATSSGGGMTNRGQAILNNSAVTGNKTNHDYGGGIYNLGTLILNNSTVSGNRAGSDGGGIKNEVTTLLFNSTISNNTADNDGGGVKNFEDGVVNFQNTIIAGNKAHDLQDADCHDVHPDGSLGYNLVGHGTGCPIEDTDLTVEPVDVFNIVLGPLQNNGGETDTHALLADSPAIDAGNPDGCEGSNGLLTTDQRGEPRPVDGDGDQVERCDIGAFEAPPVDPLQTGPIFTVNTSEVDGDGFCTQAHCTLPEAINAANHRVNDGDAPDEIHFNIPGPGPFTILPIAALPAITDPVIVDGITQAGASCDPLNLLITLEGSRAGPGVDGLSISAGHSTIRGLNIIGFGEDGLELSSQGNNLVQCNVLMANAGNGVHVATGAGNRILGNSIFNNGQLGIDLGGEGVTQNDPDDPDSGANDLQNFPVVTAAIPDASSVTIEGRLDSTPDTVFTLEFFANTSCDPTNFGEGQTFIDSTSVTTNENGNATFSGLSFLLDDPENQFVTATATGANGSSSEFSQCAPVELGNISWPRALRLTPGGDTSPAVIEQYLDKLGQSRWYRFRVQPNSRVIVTLTDLPANYDLTVYKDIAAAFDELNSSQDLLRLSAEFAPDAFATDAFAAGARSPDAFAAGARSPDAFAVENFAAEVFAAGARSPDAFAAGARSPDAFAAGARSPDVFSPDAFAAGARSPDDIAAGARSEDFFEAFASAQTRSLIGISAFEGTASERVIVNTWNNTGDFYVRVRGRDGAFSLAQRFRLEIIVLSEICNGVSADNLPETSLTPANDPNSDGQRRTLILTNLTRMTDTPVLSLTTFAQRDEIRGIVVNVGADARVAAANAQADDSPNPSCPYAKNLVADAIKRVVNRYRVANPLLEYIVIVGNDNVNPFFRYPDNALLGPESDYFPPVLDFTASEASLRLNYVLGQDEYGSQVEISLKESVLPIPDLPVGRLVETQADIIRILEAYERTNNGVVRPGSALVTGYDFFADAAESIQTELEAGLEVGATVDTLISAQDVSPADRDDPNDPNDPFAWSANQLRAQLLGSRHDLVFLGGHFSASSALAADYETRLLSTELASTPQNLLENAIIYSIGCHSGYNIVNEHNIPGLTREPDWAQAFLREGATLIAGTGYQYGDTDFIEYSERIYLEFSRQLRRPGSDPVSIGQALVAAKQIYLAQTPQIRDLHEKSLIEATIYGLPMLRVDMPIRRPTSNDSESVVTGVQPFTTGPGATLGLGYFDHTLTPSIIETTIELTDINDGSTVEVVRLASSGPNNEVRVVANPGEPVLPLELVNVSGPANLVLRGVGFRGGDYSDTPDILPLTGAPTTEIRGVHTPFLSNVFFPIQLWNINYFDALATGSGGVTHLAVTPAQFRSSSPGSETNTLREFGPMNFRLYYSGDMSNAALADAPAIVDISAVPDNGNVIFQMRVVGDPTAGIQEVWVTYTATTGPLNGSWRLLSLAQNMADTTLWEGTLDLSGTDPQDIRYMVHAVNGVGLVSLATNLGSYYIPGVDTTAQATALSLELPVTSGPYGTEATVRAVLTSNGAPLANQIVTFGLGPQGGLGVTNAEGRATTRILLFGLPGPYPVSATFAGTPNFAPSSTTGAVEFEITPQDTRLTLAEPEEGLEALLVATLEDVEGRRLFEKTVLFVVTTPGTGEVVFRESVITNYVGRAPLIDVPLAPGVYNVSVSFNDPSGAYNSSTAASSLTVPTGDLTIIKEVVGLAPMANWEFSGSGNIGPFSFPPNGGQQTFEDLPAGSYTIQETPRFGYKTEVTCTDGTTGLASVTIGLGRSDITCTFRNILQICDNILDNFNRAGPNLGSNWAGANSKGHYRIINSSVVEVISGGAAYWKTPNFGTDQEACLTLVKIDPEGHHTVLLKVQQSWNQGTIAVFYNTEGDGARVGIETYRPNQGWRTLATFPMELQAGDQLAGQALSDGTVRVFVNGVFVGEANAGPFFASKGGRIGLWFFGSGNPSARLDDFGGK